MKKIIVVILIILFTILLFLTLEKETLQSEYEKIKIELYGAPINLETSIINNDFFQIDSSGKKDCGKQISAAIKYAYTHNIEYIKLQNGKYLIDSTKEEKNIRLQDNIVLDLNSSEIIQKANGNPAYSIIKIEDKKNVTIKNGRIRGDKNDHDYDTINSTHQWGIGIDIRGAKNVTLDAIEISETTGDGVYVANIDGKNKIYVENIIIKNMNIHDCRRQGITVVSGDTIDISNNEIYSIRGNSPQAAIDLESNYCEDGTEQIKNVRIYENKLYDLGANVAIQLYRYIYNVDIYRNEINGNIKGYDGKEEINIYENKIKNGLISFNVTDKYIQSGNFIKMLNIYKNYCVNTEIYIRNVQKVNIEENDIDENKIKVIKNKDNE